MGIEMPDWARQTMSILGVPEVVYDEDGSRHKAEAEAQRQAERNATVTEASGTLNGARYHGDSATELAGNWDRTTTELSKAAAAGSGAPVAQSGSADISSGAKLMQLAQAAQAAISIRDALLLGGAATGTALAMVRAQTARRSMTVGLHQVKRGIDENLVPTFMQRVLGPLRGLGGHGGPRPALAGAGGRLPSASPARGDRIDEMPGVATMGRRSERREERRQRNMTEEQRFRENKEAARLHKYEVADKKAKVDKAKKELDAIQGESVSSEEAYLARQRVRDAEQNSQRAQEEQWYLENGG